VHQLIRQHETEIAELCRRYRVRQLDVFGSAARGQDFDTQRSDVDFLVEFQPELGSSYARTYFDFQEALEHVIGRPVDLVTESAVRNPFFRASIQRSRERVYGA
jgi:predicted nucleotidyltransferase